MKVIALAYAEIQMSNQVWECKWQQRKHTEPFFVWCFLLRVLHLTTKWDIYNYPHPHFTDKKINVEEDKFPKVMQKIHSYSHPDNHVSRRPDATHLCFMYIKLFNYQWQRVHFPFFTISQRPITFAKKQQKRNARETKYKTKAYK